MPALKTPDPSVDYSHQEMIDRSIDLFRSTFGTNPVCVASAPGRVNLIGEHTDYNNGYVLPMAINRFVTVSASPRSDKTLHIYSHNLARSVELLLDGLNRSEHKTWSNYVAGVAHFLRQDVAIGGANICIAGNVPRGAGLSSSAALELATANALSSLFGGNLPPVDMAKLCQRAENEFVGVQCGIMDQFTSAMGKAHHAILLDCQSLQYEYVPLPRGIQLLVCDTGVKRGLRNSEYNVRRQECSQAVQQLQSTHPTISSLREVSPAKFQEAEDTLDPVLRKRARHVITENERVLRSVSALRNGDLSEFGKLMYQSHFSLKTDFEVSCPELDAVVDICAESEGVFGARMTGAGFGGSAICLLNETGVEEVKTRIEREYPDKTGHTPVVYECTSEDGATVSLTR